MDYYASSALDVSAFVTPSQVSAPPADGWTPFTVVHDSNGGFNAGFLQTAATEFKERQSTPTPFVDGGAHEEQKSDREGEVQRIARQRVGVILRKNNDKTVSSELLARLEILNKRMSEMAPRVTVEQVAALEAAQLRLEAHRRDRAERLVRIKALSESRRGQS